MADMWDNLRNSAIAELDVTIFQIRQGMASECESPIEMAFLVAITLQHILNGGGYPIIGLPSADHEAEAALLRRPKLYVKSQHEFAPYRADFLIGFAGHGSIQQTGIIVECDGHDFHERTKEQAARDKERDRFLQTQAAKVIRFTGSEIFRDPMSVAENAVHIAEAAMFAWLSK